MNIRPGQLLLHYRVVEKIGEGGMSVVWRALDTELDREVAIEVLPDADVRYPLGFAVNADGSEFYVVEFDESFWRTDRIDVVLGRTDELGDLPSTGL